MPTGNRSAASVVAPLAIVAAACVLYADTLDAPYVLDDVRNIVTNPAIRWQEISLENLRSAAFESPTPRPVANVTFALNYRVGGLDPVGYRLLNTAIHALNGLLVYALALVLYRRVAALGAGPAWLAAPETRRAVAFCAALLFVVHPLQTQSVTYLVQRMNAMAAGFHLIGLLCYLRGREVELPLRRALWWGGGFVAWVLGVGSKETAVMLPVAVALVEWFFYRDLDRRFLVRGAAALAALGVVFAVVFVYHPDGLARYEGRGFTAGERLLTQLRVAWLYAGLVVFPHPGRLNLMYDLPLSRALLDPATTLLGGLGLLVTAALIAVLAPRHRMAAFALAWFLLHLVVESSVVPLAMVYEHRTYLPLVGVALGAALVPFAWLSARAAVAACAALAVVLGLATHARNQVWRDELMLWSDVVAKSPGSARAHDELGLVLAGRDRFEDAIVHYRESARLDPAKPEPYLHMGYALYRLGAQDEGLAWMAESLKRDAEHGAAHHVIGLLLLDRGDVTAALRHLERALELMPRVSLVHNNLGRALARAGRTREARARHEEAIALDPRNPRAFVHLGELALAAGRPAAAAAEFERALSVAPRSLEARNNLAWVLATTPDESVRDPGRALALAEEARARKPGDPGVLDTLAAAQAANGDFAAAAASAERAAVAAEREGKSDAAGRIRHRAALFRAGRPYLDEPAGEPGTGTAPGEAAPGADPEGPAPGARLPDGAGGVAPAARSRSSAERFAAASP